MSTTFRVIRDKVETLGPTMGRLFTDDFEMQTLERPWLGNAPHVSCIPCGTYPVVFYPSPKFHRPMPLLQNVPGREEIEIHSGNEVSDTTGCILVGYRRFALMPRLAYPTRPASDEFNRWLEERLAEDGPVTVEISYANGENA